MENQLTSLMKQKYGMTKSSPLVFTEKDTLYTSFRKLADNIYKNGEWSPEDERAAVDTMIRNQQGLPVGQETLTWRSKNTEEPQPLTITIQELSEKEKNFFEARIDSNRSGYKAITTKYDETSGAEEVKENFIFLDPTNKTGTKHNLRYYYNADADIYWDGDRVDTRTFFAEGNMNRGIGYDKLQRDILKVYDSRSEELSEAGLSRTDLERLLRDLTNPKYSGKKWSSTFRKHEYGELTDEFLETLPRDESVQYWQVPPTKEQLEEGQYDNFNWRDITTAPHSQNKLNLDKAPYILESTDGLSRRFLYPNRIKDYRKHNRAVDFIEIYIQDTYDVFLQREYEKDIEKQVRASAWQTKKNINKETQELMNQTSLNDHFGFIEVDNDVDLALFDQFEKEMNRISTLLPKTQSTADLRLRKLGNYHALGIYHPLTQTIAIDFRDYEDSIGGIGIQSFVHEYGHFLDYTSEEKMLSLEEDFQPFVARYRSNLTKLPSDSVVRNKAAYYGTPTEVWARAFEVYVSDAGLKSSFLQSADDYKIQDAYLVFDETMRKELSDYFDQRFPELKKSIEIMNEHSINEVKERTEVEEEQSQADVSSEEYEVESEESDTEEKVKETTTSIDKQKNEQLEKWNSLSRDVQNEITVIYGENPVNFQLALEKHGLEDVHEVFTGLDSVVHNEWIRRYTEELAALVKPFNEERKEWLNHYGDGKTMYIPESLWETAEKLGMMENYPKVETNTEEFIDVANEELDAIPQVNEEQDSETENTLVDENDNSRLAQAKRKLNRLEKELNGKIDQVYAHQRLTNGQPMNDKRNGQSWFNRKEQLENSAQNLSKEIESQKERVAKLEWAVRAKARGMNKQGGLIMSVDNIPRIKAEIEKSKIGESHYSRETILKYEKQLKLLEVEKEQSKVAEKNLSNHAARLIESGEITQWAKKPTIYFVKGLRKVALELTMEGDFKQSENYLPQTDKEKYRVEELLLGNEKSKEGANMAEKDQVVESIDGEKDPKDAFRNFYEELNDNEREYIQLLNDFNREKLDNHFADYSINHSHEAKLSLEEFSKKLDPTRIEELKVNYTNLVSTSISKDDSMLHMDSLYKVTNEIDEEKKEERERELLINKISQLSSEQKQYLELKVSNTLLSEEISNLNEGIIEEGSYKEYYESQLQDTTNISESISNSEKRVNEYEAILSEAESNLEKLDHALSEDEKQQIEELLSTIPYDDVQEYMEKAVQATTELDQTKENSTGEHSLESSLSSVNEVGDNRYFQVEFNESNPDIGINRYQGEIVTPELISELQSLESLAADESKSFKFYFDEVVDGDVVKHHRMDLGDQEGINKPMYGLLREGAVSKRRAMQIRPNRVVVGGRTAQRQTKMSLDDQQTDRYFRVESNEMDQRVFSTDYSGKVVTKDFITEMYKLEGKATYPEASSEFVFAEVTNGEVTDHAEIEVGRNFAENKLIYDRLSEAAVSQEKAKELENVQPIQPSSTELNETVKNNPDFNKIMKASSSEYLSDFKLALDEVFDVMEEKEEGTSQYLTRAEIDSLLDEHLTKIEKMISSYTTAAAALENATKEQKSTFLQEMLKNIKAEVTQFKENLLRTLTTKKDNVIYNVQDKTDTLRINVKNSINSRILKVNDSIRKIVEKVDQTFVLEEKELRSKIDSKTTEEQVKETTEQSVETPESPLEEKIELPKEKEEATQTSLDHEPTVETKVEDRIPASKVDEKKEIEKSVEPADEDSIEKTDSIPDNNQPDKEIIDHEPTQNNYTEQIEQLSKQLNLKITDDDRKAIEGLSTEEKEGLIQELTTTISASSKSVSTEEPELEVG
ncbi:LPD1 domain-containing protein [Enterococcus sp. AZ126]|uniref:LPD1 domain-containing protein n=1 Tax=Enterococcus sp. AZ126 TaxID=2774635 RepID=UPI003F2278F1